jgi:predicted GH43/DUF377 family glycosyl hydrolase
MSYIIFYIVVLAALGITGIVFYGFFKELQHLFSQAEYVTDFFKNNAYTFIRHTTNPLLKPSEYDFEKEAVFNPAAVWDGERTHLFYRAIGSDGISRIGYASSKDGMTIDERLPYPVYALENSNPHLNAVGKERAEKLHPELVASGGSWGGTEDPRAVVIEDRMYLTFSAFYNWDALRIGMTSISLPDLQAKRWNWSPLSYLSPKGQVHKNWVLFPEKIKGKFAILHSISPTPTIDYRNVLSAIGKTEAEIESPQGARTKGRDGFWDNWVRGAGPAPIKTDKGWLVLYHATDREKHSHEYQIGAMLLDLDNPQKVIARAPAPLLSPYAHYETNGAKPGIVYTCGATAYDDTLTVYYGASDNFVCAASTPLAAFLEKLIKQEPSLLTA